MVDLDEITLKEDIPQLEKILEKCKASVEKLRGNVQTLSQNVQDDQHDTSKGMSFLELKYHLMLMYCTCLSFYVLLKSEGRQVDGHPVVFELVRLRTVLERMRPIDKKLRYSVDKLLKTAHLGNVQSSSDPSNASLMDSDPHSFKPRPSELVAKVSGKDASAKGSDRRKKGSVYKPPMTTPVHYDPDKDAARASREERNERREKQHLMRSSLVHDLQADLRDSRGLPEAVNDPMLAAGGGSDFASHDRSSSSANFSAREAAKSARLRVEREQFEEDMFMRFRETKAELKARKNSKKRGASTGEKQFEQELGADFAELERLTSRISTKKKGSAPESKGGRGRSGKTSSAFGGDGVDDALGSVARKRRRQKGPSSSSGGFGDDDFGGSASSRPGGRGKKRFRGGSKGKSRSKSTRAGKKKRKKK